MWSFSDEWDRPQANGQHGYKHAYVNTVETRMTWNTASNFKLSHPQTAPKPQVTSVAELQMISVYKCWFNSNEKRKKKKLICAELFQIFFCLFWHSCAWLQTVNGSAVQIPEENLVNMITAQQIKNDFKSLQEHDECWPQGKYYWRLVILIWEIF